MDSPILKKSELEKLLITNWSTFLDVRKLLEFAKITAKKELKIESPKITSLTVSHCEFGEAGLLLWIDYKILEINRFVNATTEFVLNSEGSVIHKKTI